MQENIHVTLSVTPLCWVKYSCACCSNLSHFIAIFKNDSQTRNWYKRSTARTEFPTIYLVGARWFVFITHKPKEYQVANKFKGRSILLQVSPNCKFFPRKLHLPDEIVLCFSTPYTEKGHFQKHHLIWLSIRRHWVKV